MPYRRVTREENYSAWKAKRYTRAAPGKFRKSSKTISLRQLSKKQHGGKSIEAQVKERKATQSSIAAHRARITRARNAELRELQGRQASMAPADSRLVDRYIATGHRYQSLTPSEQERFRNLFTRYPDDLVRGWLGSSEESRQLRMRFGFVPARYAA